MITTTRIPAPFHNRDSRQTRKINRIALPFAFLSKRTSIKKTGIFLRLFYKAFFRELTAACAVSLLSIDHITVQYRAFFIGGRRLISGGFPSSLVRIGRILKKIYLKTTRGKHGKKRSLLLF